MSFDCHAMVSQPLRAPIQVGLARSTRRQNAGVWWGSSRCAISCTTTYSAMRAGSKMVFQ